MKSTEKTPPGDYQVLARRFRPQQFDEILGQESLVNALTNSVKMGRVGHAYLFCGPRGVGKTTVARILAKAVNCAKGPTENPCDKCQNCQEITHGNALDVLEIDGASNRGIDEIRNLRENVKYMAASSRHKIYIIDEVHMLTQEAFNALLKTLEEPPPHVKFFFATTDPQKLPATILSRCQKFELKRIPAAVMAKRLSALAKKEKVQLTQDASLAIIQQAQGSMRDAESLLEVLIGAGQTEIDFACVRDTLGLSNQEVFFQATQALSQADAKGVLNTVAELFQEGKEPGRFLAGYIVHLRNLLLVKVLGDKTEALGMPAEQIQKLGAQAAGLAEENVVALLDLAARTEQQIRSATNPRILLELFFMKAVELLQRPPLAQLLERLEQLESRLGGASGTGSGGLFTPSGPAATRPAARASDKASAAPPSANAPRGSLYEDAQPSGPPPGSDLRTTWGWIAQSLGSTHPIIRTCMQEASPVALEDDQLLVELKKGANFQKTTLEDKSCQDIIEKKLLERLGRSVKIKVNFAQDGGAAQAKPVPQKSFEAWAASALQDDPALRDALSIFKGKIIRTSPRDETNG